MAIGYLFYPNLNSAIPNYTVDRNATAPINNPHTIAPMIEQVAPSVVNISTYMTVQQSVNPLANDPFFRRFFNIPEQSKTKETQSAGSGVVINAEEGYILTNAHVIKGADKIEVGLYDGFTYQAKLLGLDEDIDLALIQIEAKNLTAVPLPNPYNVRVGDFVVAIGNPFGLGQTVTSGIISALGRSGLGIEGYEDFIQTDASINPGNSGGALVNLKGELVGINTAILAPSGGNIGIGFAIPTDIAINITNQLVKYGEVRRGVVGVVTQELTQNLSQALGLRTGYGVLINKVVDDSPAEKAGLLQGDIILSIEGKKVKSSGDLSNVLGFQPIGETVVLEVFRDGELKAFKLTIEAPRNQNIDGGTVSAEYLSGTTLSELVTVKGTQVEITALDPSSMMARLGMKKDDIIAGVNNTTVYSVDQLRQAMATNGTIYLHVAREDRIYKIRLQ